MRWLGAPMSFLPRAESVGDMSEVARVVIYRLRAMFGRRWTGFLVVMLLVALLGGVTMASIAAARRTQSSFPEYLESTNPSDMDVPTADWQVGAPNSGGSDLTLARAIARLPLVRHVANSYDINAQPLAADGYPMPPPAKGEALGLSLLNNDGSIDGEYSDQDRLTAIDGRLANPSRANEIVVSANLAEVLGLHVGDVVPIGFYTNAQTALPGYGDGSSSFRVKPHLRMDMKVVGIVDFNNQLVVDSLDETGTAEIVYTPALTRQIVGCCIASTTSYLQLDHSSSDVGAVEGEIERVAANGTLPFGVQPSISVAERAIKPESIALGVFGIIAALATLLIAAQAIGRQLRFGAGDARILRALGADETMIVGDGVAGPVIAVILGSLLAVVVAVGLSPLAPIGVVRPVYPDLGVSFDWTVLGLGFVVLVVVLSALAVMIAIRQAPHHVRGSTHVPARPSSLVRVTSESGLPPPAVEGIRFALDPGTGRETVPVRSAIVGATLAIAVVIATVTFGASLDTLVSHPPLYGWNWNYELTGGGGLAPVPGHQAAQLLDKDRSVAAWSAVWFGGTGTVDGQIVPVLGQNARAPVSPPILSGHGVEASDQIVLGQSTLSALHKRVGDTVDVRLSGAQPRHLHIVGTATMPTIGVQVGGLHPTMGSGALVSSSLIPTSVANPQHVAPPGPNAILVRLHEDADASASLRALNLIAAKLTLPENYGVSTLAAQRPAEIINYRSMGTIPALLGLGLAVGAVSALALTLVASVHRRRRTLAILKTLGFTGRQLAATVAWQSTVAVGIGTVIGVPIGIAFGRLMWNAFAQSIDAVPQPSILVISVVLVAIGGLVLGNLIAAIPGRVAARTPTGPLLRSE